MHVNPLDSFPVAKRFQYPVFKKLLQPGVLQARLKGTARQLLCLPWSPGGNAGREMGQEVQIWVATAGLCLSGFVVGFGAGKRSAVWVRGHPWLL